MTVSFKVDAELPRKVHLPASALQGRLFAVGQKPPGRLWGMSAYTLSDIKPGVCFRPIAAIVRRIAIAIGTAAMLSPLSACQRNRVEEVQLDRLHPGDGTYLIIALETESGMAPAAPATPPRPRIPTVTTMEPLAPPVPDSAAKLGRPGLKLVFERLSNHRCWVDDSVDVSFPPARSGGEVRIFKVPPGRYLSSRSFDARETDGQVPGFEALPNAITFVGVLRHRSNGEIAFGSADGVLAKLQRLQATKARIFLSKPQKMVMCAP
jgi:hypothetical protein